MCIGVPMQVIEDQGLTALCRGRDGDRSVNMMLVGPQPPGTWVLNFLGSAREVITARDAADINNALDALTAVMNGEQDIDMDRYFPDLATGQTSHGDRSKDG